MTPAAAVEQAQYILAHAWMLRTFLKHADEVADDAELIEVPRLLFDSIRAVESAFATGDHETFLRRLRGKLSKLRKASELFERRYREVSSHTNFEMAARSLTGIVWQLDDLFARLNLPAGADDVPI